MKICLINNLYKPYNRGGAEAIVAGMARSFKELGHNVFIITTKPRINRQNGREPTERDTNEDGRIFYLPSFYFNLNELPKFLRVFWHLFDMFDVFTAVKIKNILKKEKPDLVMTHNLKGLSFLAPFFIKKLGLRNIHILHDVQLYYPSGIIMFSEEKKTSTFIYRIYRSLNRYLFNYVDVVVSPTNWLLREHSRRGFFIKCQRIIFPLAFFAWQNYKKEGVKFDKIDMSIEKVFSFLFIGQLEEHKGIIFLIAAFNKFSQLYPDREVKLIVVGIGSKINKAKYLANFKVEFKERISLEGISKIIAISHCLIVPSLCYENSPTVIFRAVLDNLPVLAAALGGMAEILNDYGGVLFKPGDSDDLIYKMDRIINNYEIIKKQASQRSKNALNFVDSNFPLKFLELIQ